TLWRRAGPAADRAVAVDHVRLVPQHPFPFRGLLQQMMPGDRIVVRRIEAAVVGRDPHSLMRVFDETTVPGEPGKDREIALRDAERHVGPRRLSPLGDDEAISHQQAIWPTARAHRPEGLVPWRPLLEIAGDHLREITAPRRLVLTRMPGRGGNGV